MSETAKLRLPLLQAAQAQKHVTVNEAFVRLDALSHLAIESRTLASPPVAPQAGTTYAVPGDAGGAWSGKEGLLALWINGGWDFATPATGWRAWIVDERAAAIFDGSRWSPDAVAVSTSGAALTLRVIETDHAIGVGATSVTAPIIPGGSLVFGVTGRVLGALGGTATSFRVGIAPASLDRYGSGIGTGTGSWFRGLTGFPIAYYTDTALTVSADGGSFSGGALRLALHVAELGLPNP